MKQFAFTFAAIAMLSACAPTLPTAPNGNSGAEITVSNWTATGMGYSVSIGYYRAKAVENNNSNVAPVVLMKKPGTADVYEVQP